MRRLVFLTCIAVWLLFAGAGKANARQKRLYEIDLLCDQAATLYGVDARLLKTLAITESGENPAAVSLSGAVGLMQLMPRTAKRFRVEDAMDPLQSILGAARYLRYLEKRLKVRYGRVPIEALLAAYHTGREGGLRSATSRYVRRAIAVYKRERRREKRLNAMGIGIIRPPNEFLVLVQ